MLRLTGISQAYSRMGLIGRPDAVIAGCGIQAARGGPIHDTSIFYIITDSNIHLYRLENAVTTPCYSNRILAKGNMNIIRERLAGSGHTRSPSV